MAAPEENMGVVLMLMGRGKRGDEQVKFISCGNILHCFYYEPLNYFSGFFLGPWWFRRRVLKRLKREVSRTAKVLVTIHKQESGFLCFALRIARELERTFGRKNVFLEAKNKELFRYLRNHWLFKWLWHHHLKRGADHHLLAGAQGLEKFYSKVRSNDSND